MPRLPHRGPRLAALLVLAGLAALPAAAEIAKAPERRAPTVTAPVAMRLECWQQGQRIIAEAPLQGFNLGTALRGQAVLFQADNGAAEVVVLPLGESTCLIRPFE